MPKHHVTTYSRKQLLRYLSVRVGFPIRNKMDCSRVSELIVESGLPVISESTLYRFFLWENNIHVPYLHTLDILTKFCGFDDYKAFESYTQEIDRFTFGFGRIDKEEVPEAKSLMHFCLHLDELKPLYAFVEQLPDTLSFDKKIALGEELFYALKSNPNSNRKFFKNFAKLPIIRESFFELWADPRFLIQGYEEGIRYYLADLQPTESTSDLQDYIFANCLLFRHYYLTERSDDLKRLATSIFGYLDEQDHVLNDIHVFPAGRLIACRILHLHVMNQPEKLQKFWDFTLQWIAQNYTNWDRDQQQIIFFNIAESLMFCSPFGDHLLPELKRLFHPLLKNLPLYLQQADLKNLVPFIDKNGSVLTSIHPL